MRRSQEPGKSTLPPPRHRAHPSRLSMGVYLLRCVLPLLLRTRDPRKYSRYSPQFLQNGALSAAMSCEADILGPGSPVRTLAPRSIENAISRSGKLASEGTLIGLDCLNWRH